jgi:DNA-binding response OmpR family regulator
MMSRVLIVEDEDNISVPIAMFLGERGYDVQTARGGEEAIRMGQKFDPDILLCDWLLPGNTGGLDVAQKLYSANPAMVIVFVTGLPLEVIAARVKGLPVRHVLTKPTSLVNIARAIDDADGRTRR